MAITDTAPMHESLRQPQTQGSGPVGRSCHVMRLLLPDSVVRFRLAPDARTARSERSGGRRTVPPVRRVVRALAAYMIDLSDFALKATNGKDGEAPAAYQSSCA